MIEIIIMLFLISLTCTYLLVKLYIPIAIKHNILAPDVHKPNNPKIPTMAGIVLFILIPLYSTILFTNIANTYSLKAPFEILAIVLTIIISGIIGLLDDLLDLGLKKTFLSVIVAFPVLLLNVYYPRPLIPFIGRIRITIIYPILVVLAFLVVINATNMIDTHNGVMLTGAISVLIPMLIWCIILNEIAYVMYIIVAIGALLGLFLWNKYPAKIFPGNVGSYLTGGLLAVLIIITRKEYIALIAMLPFILHGYYLLTSIKGLMTRETIRKKIGKPVKVENGIIYPIKNENAPFTLPRLIVVAYGPMTEKELVSKYYRIFLFSSFLAVLTGIFIYYPFW